jgi:uncharacterized protein
MFKAFFRTGWVSRILNLNRLLVWAIALCLVLTLWVAIDFGRDRAPRNLILASGSPNDETYLFAQAISKVVQDSYPNLHLRVIPTLGSTQNIKLIESGQADLAIMQADAAPSFKAQAVIGLYRDDFQLVVKQNSGIHSFPDLEGKRIGLLPESGQFKSFLQIAHHYGMGLASFNFVGKSDGEIAAAFQNNEIDAVFRVRALGNGQIIQIVRRGQGFLLPIDQAAAIQVFNPALTSATIPEGTYQGYPPIPATDLKTVAVQRLMFARSTLNRRVVQKITQAIDERRRSLALALPIATIDLRPIVAQIHKPEAKDALGVTVHSGAIDHYNSRQPSFIKRNSDLFALGLNILVFTTPLLGALRLWLDRQQRTEIDEFINRTLSLVNDPRLAPEKVLELEKVFSETTAALVREEITQEAFRTFNEVYRSVREVILSTKI